MAETGKYTPIEGLVTPTVRVNLPLPAYIDQSQIGIHLGRVRTLCRMGGISHLQITGHTDDETSTAIPVMVGFNSQGGGYAGKLGAKFDIPTYRSTRAPLEGFLGIPHSARWVDGVISSNINEITQRINQNENSQVRSSEAWASHLDRAVREGIRDIGSNHLMLGLNKRDYFATPIAYTISLADEIGVLAAHLVSGSELIKAPTMGDVTFSLLFMSVWMAMINFIQYHPGLFNRSREEGSRLSLIFGPQLDRALVLQALSKRKNIIKALES
jgi:hypothetical protein